MSEPPLILDGLTSGYDKVPVIRDLSLYVSEGEVVALLGPNGVGKTTTLLTVSGIVPLLGGTVRVLGRPVNSKRPHLMARRGLAHVPEDRSLFSGLTVAENLLLGSTGRRPDTSFVFECFPPLREVQTRRAGLLSGGEQQMLVLGRALMGQPRVLLVDEMSLGLAPAIVERIAPILRTLAREHGLAVLAVEQQADVALGVADRGYILSHNAVPIEGKASDLMDLREVIEASYLGDWQP
jgi:branched-chain amino acid transport system ATP-binding protein